MSRSLSSSRRGRCSTYRTCWQMLGRRVLVQRKSVQQAPRIVLFSRVAKKVNRPNPAARRVADLCDTSSHGFFVKSLGEDLYDYRYTSHIAKSQMENHAIDA